MKVESLQEKIFKYLIKNKNLFYVVSREVSEVTKHGLDYVWDIGIKGTRNKEDKLFEYNTELKNTLRRGLSLGIKISPERRASYRNISWYEYELDYINIWILRRGFQKFEDLSPYSNKRLQQISSGIKDYCEELILTATEKLDGENSQISFFEITNQWIIGSKNVTLLCEDKHELNNRCYNENRYKVAKNVAHAWFHLLEKFKLHFENEFNEKLAYLKSILKDNTLMGELICDINRQHIINYSSDEMKIYFFGIVSKIYENHICYTPNSLLDILDPFFADYIVKFVHLPLQKELNQHLKDNSLNKFIIQKSSFNPNLKSIFNFKSIYEIDSYLNTLQLIIFSSFANSEGVVLYFIKKMDDPTKEEVLDIFKIKTLEYTNLRLLRERLRNFIIKEIPLLGRNNTKNVLNTGSSLAKNLDLICSTDNLNDELYSEILHNFLFLRLPNLSENFLKSLTKSSIQVYDALCNGNNLCLDETRKRILDDVYIYKLLFEESSIFLITISMYNQTINKIDYTQMSRAFFDQYINFLAEIKLQYSNNINILMNTEEIAHGKMNLIEDNTPHRVNDFPSGSFLELVLPPFMMTWKELKKQLSDDFSLDENTWILNTELCYLTGNKENSETKFNPNSRYCIYVIVKHTQNKCSYTDKNYFILNYKLKANKYTDSKLTTGVKSFEMEYKRPMINYCPEKWTKIYETLKEFLKKVDFIQEKNSVSFETPLTHNETIIRKLQSLSNYMPWNNTEMSNLIPTDYIINKKDFEHLIYSLIALNDINYVLNTFYNYEISSGVREIKDSVENIRKNQTGKIECTLVLPSGLPASGKSLLLKNFLYIQSIRDSCKYCETLLTSGKSVGNLNSEDEIVYSIVVNSNKNDMSVNSNDNEFGDLFDMILYVSSDGCTNRISKGYKWHCNTNFYKSIDSSDKVNNKNLNEDFNNFSIDISLLDNKKFKKICTNGRKSMKFIIDSVLRQCCFLVSNHKPSDIGNNNKNENNRVEFAPNWYKKLNELYNASRNLRILLLIDMNHTPELLSNISKSFGSNFIPNDLILYRTVVLIIPKLLNEKETEDDWPYVWSKEDLLRCILRLSKRSKHSTLKGLSLRSLNVILGFLILYSKRINHFNKKNCESFKEFHKFQLSPELVKALDFDYCIVLNNQDDLPLQNINEKGKKIINEIYLQLPSLLKHINLFSTEKEDKNFEKMLINVQKLSNIAEDNLRNTINILVEQFSKELIKSINETTTKNRFDADENLFDVKNLGKIHSWSYFPKNEIQDFVKNVRNKFSFAGVLFKENGDSMKDIIDIWNKNKDLFKKRLTDFQLNEGTIYKKVDVNAPVTISDKKHVTTYFFGHSEEPKDFENCQKANLKLLKEILPDLGILLTRPYIGKNYRFQVTYLIYIPSWKLAFLTLSPQSKLLEISAIENYITLNIKENSLSNKSIENDHLNCDKYIDCKNRFQLNNQDSNFQYTNFTSSFLLPFRKNGTSHITLFSEIFNPNISNVAINLLGKNFSYLVSQKVYEDGIYDFEICVNEEPLKHLLNKSSEKEGFVLKRNRSLRILAKNIWNKKVNLVGNLTYM